MICTILRPNIREMARPRPETCHLMGKDFHSFELNAFSFVDKLSFTRGKGSSFALRGGKMRKFHGLKHEQGLPNLNLRLSAPHVAPNP